MSFEINEGVENFDDEANTDWTAEGINSSDVWFNQDSMNLGFTMDKGNVVALRDPLKYCNFVQFTLSGSGDLLTTMQIAMGAHEWTDEEVQAVTDWTDGYKAIITQIVGYESVPARTHGMCFGVDPYTNGGYCHIYKNDVN